MHMSNRLASLAKRGSLAPGGSGKRASGPGTQATLISEADSPTRPGTKAKRGSVKPTVGETSKALAWDEGHKWKRAPGSIAGKWIDETNQAKVIDLTHGSEGHLKVRDEACRELGKGTVWVGDDERDHAHIMLEEGREGEAVVSADGQLLEWNEPQASSGGLLPSQAIKAGTVWRRTGDDDPVLGTWVDDAGERKVVRVNVNPDAVEDQRAEHANDLKSVLEKYREMKHLTVHAPHQLFELKPWLGVQVAYRGLNPIGHISYRAY